MDKKQNVLKRIPWKKVILGVAIAAPLAMITVQFIYPFNRTMLYADIDGLQVGGITKEEAASRIGEKYKATKLAVYFGDATEPYRSPSLETLGVTVDSTEVIDSVMYPLWLRFVPTSLWWGHMVVGGDTKAKVTLNEGTVRQYAEKEFGESCNITPKNASIIIKDSKFSLSPAADGGACKLDDIVRLMSDANVSSADANLRVAVEGVAPAISDEVAKKLIDAVEPQIRDGVELKFEKEVVKVDADTVRSWLSFAANKDKIDMKIDATKVKNTINQRLPMIAKAAGSLTIKLKDGRETSRSGSSTEGRALNVDKTVDVIKQYLLGKEKTVNVAVTTIKPQIKYEQSYSTTAAGFSAMLRRFAESNPGVYGVSLVELSGKRRTASYNETRNFFPASTYKLFVAFSTIKRVENGTYSWSSKKVGKYTLPYGRTLSSCFDYMITHSDNACAETLRDAISYGGLNKDLRSIGIYGITFIAPGQHLSNARDITSFLVKLETGSLPISGSNRGKLLSAMRSNVYRSGVPAGASGAVADKVGFIDALLHDAAIVYSPSGTYVVTIMSDNSSWGNIAKLTREIEKFRAQ